MWCFKKLTSAYLFQIAREKSYDYVLIYMNKDEIAYHNYAEAKRALQVALCVRSKQPRTIKTIIYKDIFTSLRRKKFQSPAKHLKVVQSGLLLLCTELNIFCIELPENCVYLNQF